MKWLRWDKERVSSVGERVRRVHFVSLLRMNLITPGWDSPLIGTQWVPDKYPSDLYGILLRPDCSKYVKDLPLETVVFVKEFYYSLVLYHLPTIRTSDY